MASTHIHCLVKTIGESRVLVSRSTVAHCSRDVVAMVPFDCRTDPYLIMGVPALSIPTWDLLVNLILPFDSPLVSSRA
jgi:hypothetical protein